MLLKNSISSTKNFWQKTFQGFKSFFSGGHYLKLPNTPPYNRLHKHDASELEINSQKGLSNNGLDKFNNDLTNRSDRDHSNKGLRRNRRKLMSSPRMSPPTKPDEQVDDDALNGSFMNFAKLGSAKRYHTQRRDDYTRCDVNNGWSCNEGKKFKKEDDSSSNCLTKEGRIWWVAQKLKEMEMMDLSNVDHILDIEEVLHYYSRITCTAYLDIIDNFFKDMCAEFFGPPPVTPSSVNSRHRLRADT
ncbi:hypothetical protein K2173_004248 [Erythroxylum novogranatense]|uniref:Ovate family protein n=1 Tax=Erythroxylum novogranatense TaxID=1862640 RepID=A0AAV8TUR1_9ROSI|nr:hypothetical protein K2173_004248 [Erythroxylum novogranatense]